MDFRFTPEQEQFRDSVRRFAAKHRAEFNECSLDVSTELRATG